MHNQYTEITPELGNSGVITQADMDSAKRLAGNFTSVLSGFVRKALRDRNQNEDVHFISFGDKPLPLHNFEYNTNSIVLKVTGTNVNMRKKKAIIEDAVQAWFSPVRTGYANHQCLRYKYRGLDTQQAGVVSKLIPSSFRASSSVSIYVVHNIILVFEG